MCSIFIHRRDLRIEDNLALFNLLSVSDTVLPVFIFDPNQIVRTNKNKHYFSEKAAYFIINSVLELKKCYNNIGSDLLIMYDEPVVAIKKIMNIIEVTAISFVPDYSDYAIARDKTISDLTDNFVSNSLVSDFCLNPWKHMLKNENKPYVKFSSFYANVTKHKPLVPICYKNLYKRFMKKGTITKLFKKIAFKNVKKITPKIIYTTESIQAGRQNCINSLMKNIKHLQTYNKDRNNMSYTTSKMSAYLNIGTISCREYYFWLKEHLGSSTDLLKQLYWRDFYLCIVAYLPNGNKFNHIDDNFDNIKWASDADKTTNKYKLMVSYWKRMMAAQTGFLIIDAAIKELTTTGFLHGRARMILGTFWIKYLLINPFDKLYGSQSGYSKLLIDAIGPSQNKMNHQWLTELDYGGRRFGTTKYGGRKMNIDNNMIKKFDPECIYIKKWLPHLNNIPNKDLYKWSNKIAHKYNDIHQIPMFNQDEKYDEWNDITN